MKNSTHKIIGLFVISYLLLVMLTSLTGNRNGLNNGDVINISDYGKPEKDSEIIYNVVMDSITNNALLEEYETEYGIEDWMLDDNYFNN